MSVVSVRRGGPEAHRLGPRIRWAVWSLYLLAWSAALLTPHPMGAARALLPSDLRFLAAKALHVSAYALLAILTGWLRAGPRSRWLLLALLSGHAFATEFGQRFVALRTGSWRDVGLNHLGLLLGVALTWYWWRSPAQATSPQAKLAPLAAARGSGTTETNSTLPVESAV